MYTISCAFDDDVIAAKHFDLKLDVPFYILSYLNGYRIMSPSKWLLFIEDIGYKMQQIVSNQFPITIYCIWGVLSMKLNRSIN